MFPLLLSCLPTSTVTTRGLSAVKSLIWIQNRLTQEKWWERGSDNDTVGSIPECSVAGLSSQAVNSRTLLHDGKLHPRYHHHLYGRSGISLHFSGFPERLYASCSSVVLKRDEFVKRCDERGVIARREEHRNRTRVPCSRRPYHFFGWCNRDQWTAHKAPLCVITKRWNPQYCHSFPIFLSTRCYHCFPPSTTTSNAVDIDRNVHYAIPPSSLVDTSALRCPISGHCRPASNSQEDFKDELEDSDVMISDYPSTFVNYLSLYCDKDSQESTEPKVKTLSVHTSFHESVNPSSHNYSNHNTSTHHTMTKNPISKARSLEAVEEDPRWREAKCGAHTQKHLWRGEGKVKESNEAHESLRSHLQDFHPFFFSSPLTCEGVEANEAFPALLPNDSPSALPLSSHPFTSMSHETNLPWNYGSLTPMRKRKSATTAAIPTTTVPKEMEGSNDLCMTSFTTIDRQPPLSQHHWNSFSSTTTLPSRMATSSLAHAPSREIGAVGTDVVDLVTDALKEQREKAVAERRRLLYTLTHPILTDYTYKKKLIPPPPFHFGRITQEAKDLAQKILVHPSYSLVLQAGTRYAPSLDRSTVSRSSLVTNSPSCSVEHCGGRRNVVSSRHPSLSFSSPTSHRHSRAHRDPHNIFAHHNYFFEINELYQEIVLVGRASAGKSSLLNAILQQPNMASTSSTPHTTRSINFYQSCTKEEMRRFYEKERHQLVKLPGKGLQLTFVDIPGFGIEGMSDRWRDETITLTDNYFGTRRSINTVLFCLDVDKGLTKIDIKYFNWLENVQGVFFIVLTKCDSVPHSRICAVMHEIYALITKNRKKFRKVFPFILPTSAVTGENMDDLRGLIMETSGMITGQHLREKLQAKKKAWELTALQKDAKRQEEAYQIHRRRSLEYYHLCEKDKHSLSDDESVEKKHFSLVPSVPHSLLSSSSSSPPSSLRMEEVLEVDARAIIAKGEANNLTVVPTEAEREDRILSVCSSTTPEDVCLREKRKEMERRDDKEDDRDACSSSSLSPPPLAWSRKEFLQWREAHPQVSHTLAYEGHRVKLHSGLNSPHISAVSEEITNSFASKMETAVDRRREEVKKERERQWSPSLSSSSSDPLLPSSRSTTTLVSTGVHPSSAFFSPTTERSRSPLSTLSSPCHALDTPPSAPSFLSSTTTSSVCSSASFLKWKGGRGSRITQSLTPPNTTMTATPTIIQGRSVDALSQHSPPSSTPAVHASPISSVNVDRRDETTGGRGGVVSTFLDQFQKFQLQQPSHLRHHLSRKSKREFHDAKEKQVTERNNNGDDKKPSSSQHNALNLSECSFVPKNEKWTCGQRNEPFAASVEEKEKKIHSDLSSSSLQTCKVHRSPFFAQDETGRLAAFTAGKRSGPSVASLDSPVYYRKGEWKGKGLGMLLQHENPEAPWQAMGSLRQKIDEAQKELLIPNLSSRSSSVIKVRPKYSHHSKKSNAAFSTMSRKDKEAYLRYAGRLTSSFEQFEGEVTCTKYMTEVRQAKTIRSREQMHFNATGKINYRSMPKGLWKEYGNNNTPDPSSRGKRNTHDVMPGDLPGSSSSGSKSSTGIPCGSRDAFRPSGRTSFSSCRVLGC